jgi:hypothetical protein
MGIQTGLTKKEAQKIKEPKVVVCYDGDYTVYTDTDLDTPPFNPAEGDGSGEIIPVPSSATATVE